MKWAITKRNSDTVLMVYEANAADYSRFGGPWGDPGQSEHIQVRDDASELSASEMKAQTVDVVVGYIGESTNELVCAYDQQRQKLIAADGSDLMVEKRNRVPVIEARRMAIPK